MRKRRYIYNNSYPDVNMSNINHIEDKNIVGSVENVNKPNEVKANESSDECNTRVEYNNTPSLRNKHNCKHQSNSCIFNNIYSYINNVNICDRVHLCCTKSINVPYCSNCKTLYSNIRNNEYFPQNNTIYHARQNAPATSNEKSVACNKCYKKKKLD